MHACIQKANVLILCAYNLQCAHSFWIVLWYSIGNQRDGVYCVSVCGGVCCWQHILNCCNNLSDFLDWQMNAFGVRVCMHNFIRFRAFTVLLDV